MTIFNNFFSRRITQLLRLASVLILAGCALWLGLRVPVNYARTVTPANPLFAQETKLTASNGAAFHYFGSSVAISGNTAVVGAPGDSSIAESTARPMSLQAAERPGISKRYSQPPTVRTLTTLAPQSRSMGIRRWSERLAPMARTETKARPISLCAVERPGLSNGNSRPRTV